MVFLKKVLDPQRFEVPVFENQNSKTKLKTKSSQKLIELLKSEEKPKRSHNQTSRSLDLYLRQ